MKIVILDGGCANPGDCSWDELQNYGELSVYDRTDKADLVARACDADIILTNKMTMREDVFSQLPQLKYVGVLATGYNTIDVEAAKKRNILVANVPAYSTNSVAQMTFAHILNIANRVDYYAVQNREGRWSESQDFCYWNTPLHELTGKTIGIVGLGDIGCKVAAIARQFGMDVFALTSKNSADLPAGIQKTTFEGLLSVSDILTLHCPLNEETRGMINREALSKMRPGSILINTGRGPLIDEEAVAEALRSGKLAAYGADVLSSEPPKADNPLLALPNAFITPHIAWATLASRSRLVQTAIENVKAFVEGKPQNIVNL